MLYPTARLILGHIVKQESRRDATCWTTVRMMEQFYARRPMGEHASLLKIEASKVLVYHLWRNASAHSPKATLDAAAISAVTPSFLRRFSTILARQGVPSSSPLAFKLKHYHQVTENWRLLLAIAMESLTGEGLFGRGVVDLKPLTYTAAARLADLSTSLTIRLLQRANRIAQKKRHHAIHFADLQESFRALVKRLRAKPLGPHRVQVRIRDKARGRQLARRLTLQNMAQKVRSLRVWNHKVWRGNKSHAQLLKLLNRLAPIPLARGTIPYLLSIFRVGLGTLALGNDEKPSPSLVAPLSRAYITAPKRAAELKGLRYLSLSWVSQRLEDLFPHKTLVNGDVHLSYGMRTPQGSRFFKKEMIGPDLDAMRDVTLHWEILRHIWKDMPQARPLDPFAAEVLAERISEYLVFYLRMAPTLFQKGKVKRLSVRHLQQLTRQLMFLKFLRSMPEVFRWDAKVMAQKKALMKGYPNGLFAAASAPWTRRKPCDAWTPHLHQKKYAFVQKVPYFKYVPRVRSEMIDPSRAARRRKHSSDPDTLYPGIQIWNGPAVAVGDVDGDGLPDLFFSGEGCNRLYRNLGQYKFEDITEKVGLVNQRYDSHHALFADVNNDGRLDLLVLHAMSPSRLFVQQPNGRFVDATQASGLRTGVGANVATFFDYDNDGDLDLYVGRFGSYRLRDRQMPSIDGRNGRPNQMFRNDGKGRFVEVTRATGLGSTGWTMSAVALDANQDGKLDLFLANDFGRDELYLNQGDGTFRDVARTWGVDDRTNGMNASWTDFNHDGRLDLYVSVIDMFSKELRFILPRARDLVQINEHILRSSFYLSGNKFYVSDPKRKDLYRSQEHAVFEPRMRGWSWSGVFFDLDNDGDEDFYLVNGWAPRSYANNQPNQLFVREGRRYFLVQRPSDASYRGNSRSAVAVDLTGTGRMDLVLNDFRTGPRLLKNIHPSRHRWLKVRLEGKRSNRRGVGARVRLWVKGLPPQLRQVSAGINYMAQDDTTLTFGLGQAPLATALLVIWPDGTQQKVKGPLPAGKTIVVKEQR